MADLPAETRADLQARAEAQPFARGNLWQATRGDQTVTLVGTFHLDDPRHDATLTTLLPRIEGAATVLVEAGSEEQARLKDRIGKDPSLIIDTTGPTLRDRLDDADWEALSQAMADRGMPSFMVAQMRPWYVSTLLAMPPCLKIDDPLLPGLDGRIIETATKAGVPVKALEPYDTLFSLFDGLSPDDELAMIRTALTTEGQSADQMHTTAEAYFRGDNRLLWEYSRLVAIQSDPDPARAEQAMDEMEERLINARNRAWIPVIETAAETGPVLAAFGALHLPGTQGVLALLQDQGWTITPITP